MPAVERSIDAFLSNDDSPDIGNPIHSTEIAKKYGFKGALVGGVTVYGWAVPAILEALGDSNDPQMELALRLEEIALSDEYFIERKLYPNVDFYSGLIYKAIGIPRNMFTVMFAIARTVGWVTHWQEMMGEPDHRIGRPRQLYLGEKKRDFVPRSARG